MMELQEIQNKIYEIRGRRIMLDFDLAILYEVTTGNLNKAVKRNVERFPERFMFQLTKDEFDNLIFQNGTSSWGGTRKLPYAFTEQGVSMLSAVLRSSIAIKVSINIMDAFVAMREYILSSTIQSAELNDLKHRVKALEQGCDDTLEAVNDLSEDLRKDIDSIYQAIAELSVKPVKTRRPIGFNVNDKEA